MPKNEKNTLAWIKTHIQPGENMAAFVCMNGKDRTITGEKLLMWLRTMQSIALSKGATYEFYVEKNDPDNYYPTWEAENSEFFNDPGLKATGGVKDINALLKTKPLLELKDEYLGFVKDKAIAKINLQKDIDEVLKDHPEWKNSAAEHILGSALILIALARPQSNQNNLLVTHVWYPKKLSRTQSHALQILQNLERGGVKLESDSVRHFKFSMNEVRDNYLLSHPPIAVKQAASITQEEKQTTTVTDAAERSSMSVSPQNSPPLDAMSSDDSSKNSPQKQPKTMRDVSPPKLDISADAMLQLQMEKELIELQKAKDAYELAQEEKRLAIERERHKMAMERSAGRQMELELELRLELHRTQLLPLALGNTAACSSTYLVQRAFSGEEQKPAAGNLPPPRFYARPPALPQQVNQTYSKDLVAGLMQNGFLTATRPTVVASATSSTPTLPPPRPPSTRGGRGRGMGRGAAHGPG